MKAGWQAPRFGDVCELKKGKKPTLQNAGTGGVKPYLVAKYLRGAEPTEFASVSDKNSVSVSANEIIIICDGSNSGETFIGFDGILSSTMAKIGHGNGIDNRFLMHFLDSLFEKFNAAKTGAAIPHLDLAALRDEVLPLPPLPDQHRIVAILDEAFDGIATAKANAEKNLQNAKALFESHLQSVFNQLDEVGDEQTALPTRPVNQSTVASNDAEMTRLNAGHVTRTGGREATLRHIPGPLSLAVGMPNSGARRGWRWAALAELARLESGHTPSRRHPEYWGGSIPWIGIQDARENHGQSIYDTSQKTNELGIANSSARVLPENTVCLSRTASVGYVTLMARPMATSQDFVNWVCSDKLKPDFLKYLFLAEGREGLLRYASGAVHQTIYFPEAKAFHVCIPEPEEQLRIVRQCDSLREETQRLESLFQQKLTALDDLKKSLLHQAFSGEL